jgi:hypothetical protein
MPLSHDQRETVQLAVLQQLDAAHPRLLTAKALIIPLTQSGLAALDEAALHSLLTDMTSTGLVMSSASDLAAEVIRYTRTDKGRVALRAAGF